MLYGQMFESYLDFVIIKLDKLTQLKLLLLHGVHTWPHIA